MLYYRRLGIPREIFLVDLPVKILKALLSPILATYSAHVNFLHLICLNTLGER